MKYKVGDKVRVRKDLKCGEWYTNKSKSCGVLVTKGMSRFIGKEVTIIATSPYGDYRIKEDNEPREWAEILFEGLANEAPSITKRINEKHNILNGLTKTDDALTEKLESQNDLVNHPSHYTDGKIEVIDFIEDKKLGYHLGNACKYISRCQLKNDGRDKVQDLRKAIWYIERQIHLWEG